MIELILILLALLAVGFIFGGFIAFLVAIISVVAGYFIGVYAAIAIVSLVAIGGCIQKFRNNSIINQ